MTEICMNPLFPAILFWVGLSVFLSLHLKVKDLFSVQKGPLLSLDNSGKEVDNAFLEEIVRLAEERIKEQGESNRTYERKAVLLATLCLAILGYLLHDFLQGKLLWLPKESLWMHIILWTLIASILSCVRAINFAPYGPLGLHPIVTSEFINNPTEDALDRTRRHLLEEYAKRINLNEERNGTKHESMIIAMVFWVIGTGALLGVIFSYLYGVPCATLASQLCG